MSWNVALPALGLGSKTAIDYKNYHHSYHVVGTVTMYVAINIVHATGTIGLPNGITCTCKYIVFHTETD